MTMRFVPNLSIPLTDGTLIYLFEFLDFMRTASPSGPGWTIPRSSNGTTGGAGDNISSFADLSQYSAGVSESWFVLRQPDGAREYLWFRTNASDTVWSLSYSPTASYVGGTAGTPPTAADAKVVHGAVTIMAAAINVLHMGADDAAPYGWFTYVNINGDLTNAQAAMAMIPITDGLQPGEVDPIVFYFDGGNGGYTEALSGAESGGAGPMGLVPGSATFANISAQLMRSNIGTTFPNGCAQDTNGDDVRAPIAFARRAGIAPPNGFKGYTDFMQWNGVTRAAGETFNSLSRVSWGAVNFEWDGATVPSAT